MKPLHRLIILFTGPILLIQMSSCRRCKPQENSRYMLTSSEKLWAPYAKGVDVAMYYNDTVPATLKIASSSEAFPHDCLNIDGCCEYNLTDRIQTTGTFENTGDLFFYALQTNKPGEYDPYRATLFCQINDKIVPFSYFLDSTFVNPPYYTRLDSLIVRNKTYKKVIKYTQTNASGRDIRELYLAENTGLIKVVFGNLHKYERD